jgi:FkbM family methyltransferase
MAGKISCALAYFYLIQNNTFAIKLNSMSASISLRIFMKIARRLLSNEAGFLRSQESFEELHKLALRGMNMGGGAHTESSGERAALEYIARKFTGNDTPVLFDVGANVGNYALLLDAVFGGKAQIHSFEPSSKTYARLVENTRNLKNCRAHLFGLGQQDESRTLFSNHDESGLASVYERRLDHFNINMSQKEEIRIKTLDGFCSENNIQRIHLLKMDVEGHEINVLHGARQMLESGKIEVMQFEFGGCNIDSRTYFQDFYYLLKDRYRISRIVKDGLYPIENYREQLETFTTTNYIAEKR